jgi:hypothetical protein
VPCKFYDERAAGRLAYPTRWPVPRIDVSMERFLAWRRMKKKVPETPARRLSSYVGAVAWFALGVLTLAFVAASQRPGRGQIAATLPPASAEIDRPLTSVEPALLIAERSATAGAGRVSATGDHARPERPVTGRKALSPPASVHRHGTAIPPVAVSRLTATVDKARRWVGYMPEMRVGKALVHWVKSQPPPDGGPLAAPDRPQTL